MRVMTAFSVALVFTVSVLAAPPGGGGGQGPGQGTGSGTGGTNPQASAFPTPLYQMNNVGPTLKLDTQQMTKLDALNTQLQDRMRTDFQGLGKLSENERAARQMQLNQQFQSDFNSGAKDILKDDQYQRYQQLWLQQGGFSSLSDPKVQERLGFTADQKKNLQAQIDWSNQQMAAIDAQAQSKPSAAANAYKTYQSDFQTRFNDFLTPQQQKTWSQMTGEPFTFSRTFGSSPQR
jgi:hypothetical protein